MNVRVESSQKFILDQSTSKWQVSLHFTLTVRRLSSTWGVHLQFGSWSCRVNSLSLFQCTRTVLQSSVVIPFTREIIMILKRRAWCHTVSFQFKIYGMSLHAIFSLISFPRLSSTSKVTRYGMCFVHGATQKSVKKDFRIPWNVPNPTSRSNIIDIKSLKPVFTTYIKNKRKEKNEVGFTSHSHSAICKW